jgi:hypothetical protein
MALSTVTLAATERDRKIVLVWTPDDTPTDRWEITRDGTTVATLYDVNAVTWTDYEVSNNVAYEYVVTGQDDDVASAAVTAVAGPRAYGVIDPLESSIRYTTLAEVKAHFNIDDTAKDAYLTQAIIAVESAIDRTCGRSFPDPSGGEIQGVPEAIKQVATSASIAVYNNLSTPSGSGGSDDWFGEQEQSLGEVIRREVRRSPLLMGYKVSFGVAGGTTR